MQIVPLFKRQTFRILAPIWQIPDSTPGRPSSPSTIIDALDGPMVSTWPEAAARNRPEPAPYLTVPQRLPRSTQGRARVSPFDWQRHRPQANRRCTESRGDRFRAALRVGPLSSFPVRSRAAPLGVHREHRAARQAPGSLARPGTPPPDPRRLWPLAQAPGAPPQRASPARG